jgi:hypothetical protein
MKLAVVQVDVREDSILLEEIVAHDRVVEKIGMRFLLQLLVAAHQEEHLRLKGVAARVLVEVLEEGIRLGLLEDQLGVQPLGQELREAGLAGPDHSFDGDVASAHGRQAIPVNTRNGRPCGRAGWEEAS